MDRVKVAGAKSKVVGSEGQRRIGQRFKLGAEIVIDVHLGRENERAVAYEAGERVATGRDRRTGKGEESDRRWRAIKGNLAGDVLEPGEIVLDGTRLVAGSSDPWRDCSNSECSAPCGNLGANRNGGYRVGLRDGLGANEDRNGR